ncbi:MAG: lysophospholipid acyltransferase family protein [Elusimicrobiota bacterium]|jgi:lauroyl/myristoyl acyltransferase
MLTAERALYRLLGWVLDEGEALRILSAAHLLTLRLPVNRKGITNNLQRISRHARQRDLAPDELEALFQEIAKLFTLLIIDHFKGPESWPELARAARLDFLPELDGLLARGRGALLVTPHFGNHPLFMYALACRGTRLDAVYNYGTSFRSLAERYPSLRLHDVGHAAAEILKTLRDGGAVLTLCDVDYFPDNRTVEFFGAPYFPPHGPARLSLASGAPILPVYALLEDDAWRLVNDPPIDPAESDQAGIESHILRSMERRIAAKPGHWLQFRDAWDLAGNLAALREQLKAVHSNRMLSGLWEKVWGPFRPLRGPRRGP